VAEADKSTEEIIRDLKQGRDPAENFRLLYNRYGGPIRNYFEKKGVPESNELKDDVFLAVYQNLEGLREETRFEAWLFKIASNRYKNWLKQQKTAKRVVSLSDGEEEIDPPAPTKISPEFKMMEKESLTKVWEALQELPPQKRLVAILAWVEERSPKEIACILPITINTVYAHLHQAQKILKERLKEYFDEL
jgi:RNA polymerase sigma-70 factor (ECF subfamily)